MKVSSLPVIVMRSESPISSSGWFFEALNTDSSSLTTVGSRSKQSSCGSPVRPSASQTLTIARAADAVLVAWT